MSYEGSWPRGRECGVIFQGFGLRGRVANPMGLWTLTPPICVGGAAEGGIAYDDADDAMMMDPLGRSWGSLGPSWGPSWGRLGGSRGYPKQSWKLLGPSWEPLGRSWGPLEPSWGTLGPSWGPLEPSSGPLRALLGPSWAVLGLS